MGINSSLPILNSSMKAETLDLGTETVGTPMHISCEPYADDCINPEHFHSEIPVPDKSDSKIHLLEIRGLKETPPDVDPLRAVVCTIQTRL